MRAAHLALAMLVLVLAAACSDLPDVAPDVCGNGVIDPGEDCDGAAGSGNACARPGDDHACHFVCTGSATCPSGFACGVDQQCRAPSGVFRELSTSYAFSATDVAAGDVDGDGIADLVGISDINLTTRFGDANGGLEDVANTIVEQANGPPAFGNLDGQPGMDVVIPSDLGVFTLLASGRTYEPFAYSSFDLGDGPSALIDGAQYEADGVSDLLSFIGTTATYLPEGSATFPTMCLDGTLAGSSLCLTSPDIVTMLGDQPLIGRTGLELAVGSAGTATSVPIPQDVTDEVILAFKGDSTVALWSAHVDAAAGSDTPPLNPRIVLVQKIALPPQFAVATSGQPAFGNFDHDGCLDLLIPIQQAHGTAVEGFVIAYGAKTGPTCNGKFEDASTDGIQVPVAVGATTAGFSPLAVADFDGDGLGDIVTNGAVVLTACSRGSGACSGWGPGGASANPRTWSRAVITDFNADGRPDIAASVDGEQSVDAMLNVVNALFTRFTIATTAPVHALAASDFDGDLIGDIAIISGDPAIAADEQDVLSVAYGQTSGGPTTPVEMGEFGQFQSFALVLLPNVTFDVITDLVLVAKRDGKRRASALFGSTSRRLLAPFELPGGELPTGVAMGNYDKVAGADLLVLAPIDAASEAITFLSGAGDGDLVEGASGTAPSTAFGFGDAAYASGPLTPGAAQDVIFGVDTSAIVRAPGVTQIDAAAPRAVLVDSSAGLGMLPTIVQLDPVYDGLTTRSVQLSDFDGDGTADALVELAAHDFSTGSTVLLASGADLASFAEIISASDTCGGVTAIQLDADAASELAAECRDSVGQRSLRLFDFASGAWTVIGDYKIAENSDGRVIAGDFNGDGVVDVAITTGAANDPTEAISVRVYLQCAAGDAACTSAATAVSP